MIRKLRESIHYVHRELGVISIGDRLTLDVGNDDRFPPNVDFVVEGIRPFQEGEIFLHRSMTIALRAEKEDASRALSNPAGFTRPILQRFW